MEQASTTRRKVAKEGPLGSFRPGPLALDHARALGGRVRGLPADRPECRRLVDSLVDPGRRLAALRRRVVDERLRALMSLPTLESIFSQLAVEQDTTAISREIVDLVLA